jgi:hypothetical protein
MAFNDFAITLHTSSLTLFKFHCPLSCVYAAAAAMNGNTGFKSLDDVIGPPTIVTTELGRYLLDVPFCLLSFVLWCSILLLHFSLWHALWIVDFDAFSLSSLVFFFVPFHGLWRRWTLTRCVLQLLQGIFRGGLEKRDWG